MQHARFAAVWEKDKLKIKITNKLRVHEVATNTVCSFAPDESVL